MPGNYFVITIMQFLLKFAAPKNNSSLVLTKFTINGNYTLFKFELRHEFKISKSIFRYSSFHLMQFKKTEIKQ